MTLERALAAAAGGACFARSALVGSLAAVEHVVGVEERVRQVVELASLVVGEALEQTLAGLQEDRHVPEACGGGGLRGAPGGGPPIRACVPPVRTSVAAVCKPVRTRWLRPCLPRYPDQCLQPARWRTGSATLAI